MKYKLTLISFLALLLASCSSQYQALQESTDIEAKYKGAFDYFNAGKYAKAAALFESLQLPMNGTPQDDTVQFYTGYAHYKDRDLSNAEPCFETFINTYPRSPFADKAAYLRIQCLYDATYRYQLDQTPTYKTINVISQYISENPDSKYKAECLKILEDLDQRLDKKQYESAKLYYTIEEYKSAHYALKNVLKENAENIYREDILYYTAMSAYKYALNSVKNKQKERYMIFSDDYYNFVGEYPDSKYKKELDNLFEKVQKFLD